MYMAFGFEFRANKSIKKEMNGTDTSKIYIHEFGLCAQTFYIILLCLIKLVGAC